MFLGARSRSTHEMRSFRGAFELPGWINSAFQEQFQEEKA